MKHLNLIYFSPTGGTEKIARKIASFLANETGEIDLSNLSLTARELSSDAVAIAAVPVYAGRVPALALNALGKINGKGARVVSVAVYGNRHYDDALVELNDTLTELGFVVIASGAFIAEHSLVNELAAGRPDESDYAFMKEFANGIIEKIDSGKNTMNIVVPGNRPYVDASPVKSPIFVTERCTNCGTCAERCPAGAINKTNTHETNMETCIVCMRCKTICPEGARSLPNAVLKKFSAHLLGKFSKRRENEMFF